MANVTALATWVAGSLARHALQPAAGPRRRAAHATSSASAPSSSAAARTTSPAPPATASDDKRIRLQDLPNLTKNPGDGIGFAAWPAYRVSNGQMWSMQLRLNDCFRQQRFPYPGFALGRDDRAGHLHGRQRQGRRVDRAGHQALKPGRMHMKNISKCARRRGRPGCCWPAAPAAPIGRRRHSTRRSQAMMQGLVPRPGHRQGRPPATRTWGRRPARPTSRPATRWPSRSRPQALATVKWPAGGQYIGDWKAGEKLAQSGRGMTWTDKSSRPQGQRRQLLQLPPDRQGGNLLRHDRPEPVELRQDPRRQGRDRPHACADVVQYTWGKLWNSKAYAACSNMPRFGHQEPARRIADCAT